MYNKLIDRRTRSSWYSNEGAISQEIEYRRTGKSTARALEIISQAMSRPGTPIPLYEVGYNDNAIMRHNFRCTVHDLLLKLDMKHFILRHATHDHRCKERYEHVLIYDVFTNNPWEIT